jgi:hypothetical protein
LFGGALFAGALAMLAARPATGPALAFFQFLLGPANATLPSHFLLGILDPADELVTGQRRDVFPRSERLRVADQRVTQVCGQLVHRPARYSLAAHRARVASVVRLSIEAGPRGPKLITVLLAPPNQRPR